MPRRPRTHLDATPLHIVQRRHNRDAFFFTDEDYTAYRELLGEALKATGCQLHAYVLMTDDYRKMSLAPLIMEVKTGPVLRLDR